MAQRLNSSDFTSSSLCGGKSVKQRQCSRKSHKNASKTKIILFQKSQYIWRQIIYKTDGLGRSALEKQARDHFFCCLHQFFFLGGGGWWVAKSFDNGALNVLPAHNRPLLLTRRAKNFRQVAWVTSRFLYLPPVQSCSRPFSIPASSLSSSA